MAVLRVFTAIAFPPDIARKLDTAIERHLRHPGLRTVGIQAQHITLNFVGDVEDREIPELCQAFSAAIRDLPPFEIQLEGFGAFPDLQRPRVLWIGIEEGTEPLIHLNRQLRDVIEEFGFVQEKRYQPHVTVARVQNQRLEPASLNRIRAELGRMQWRSFRADEVIVYNSLLEKKGPTYIPIATLPLTGPNQG